MHGLSAQFASFVIGGCVGALVMYLECAHILRREVGKAAQNGYAKGWEVATSLIRDKSRRAAGYEVTGIAKEQPPRV